MQNQNRPRLARTPALRVIFIVARASCGTAIPSTSLGTGLAVVARASSPCPTRKTAKFVVPLNTYSSPCSAFHAHRATGILPVFYVARASAQAALGASPCSEHSPCGSLPQGGDGQAPRHTRAAFVIPSAACPELARRSLGGLVEGPRNLFKHPPADSLF